MPMTRKGFAQVAATVKRHRESLDEVLEAKQLETIDDLVEALCYDFERWNPSFKRDVFLRNCGL